MLPFWLPCAMQESQVLIQPFDHELKDFFLFRLIMDFMIQVIPKSQCHLPACLAHKSCKILTPAEIVNFVSRAMHDQQWRRKVPGTRKAEVDGIQRGFSKPQAGAVV